MAETLIRTDKNRTDKNDDQVGRTHDCASEKLLTTSLNESTDKADYFLNSLVTDY